MNARTDLPRGDATFLFTDIEGSTRLLHLLGDGFVDVLQRHHRLLRESFARHRGVELRTEGDAFFVVFASAADAVAAAVDAQSALLKEPWPDGGDVRIRVGIHSGQATQAGNDYIGLAVHKAARIAAAANGGQILLSAAVASLVRGALPEGATFRDLGEHLLKDFERPVRLFDVRHEDLLDDLPPVRTLSTHPNNLPVVLTSFIGRGRELTALKETLSRARLVTITGGGGAGKTRLALEVAGELFSTFKDGVWFVDLHGVADPDLVPAAIASAAGIRERGSDILVDLQNGLRGRSVLFVFDNCEHLLAAAARAGATILAGAPTVRILATSQAPLGVPGEHVWQLAALEAPEEGDAESADALLRFDAVRLFVDRAARRRTDFVLDANTGPSVAAICARLQGVPLAIELAAARVTMLHPSQIAERLDRRFGLLTGGSRQAPARQRTLRATVEWSYELLSQSERALFEALSVFRGSFSLDAAERVCASALEEDVFGLLSRLVDRSFVTADLHPDQPRYRILETMRTFGEEMLEDRGAGDAVRRAHLAWLVETTSTVGEQVVAGGDQTIVLQRLDRDHDNVRAGLSFAIALPDPAAAMLIVSGMWWYWSIRGLLSEGAMWVDRVLAVAGAETTARRTVLAGAANLAIARGDVKAAESYVEEMVSLSEGGGDLAAVAAALSNLATVASTRGDFRRALDLYLRCVEIRRGLDDRPALARSLGNLALQNIHLGDFAQGEVLLEEASAICSELHDARGSAYLRLYLGTLRSAQGRFDEAHEIHGDALDAFVRLGDVSGQAHCLVGLSTASLGRGDQTSALEEAERAREVAERMGSPAQIARAKTCLAAAAFEDGDLGRARRMAEDALHVRRASEDRAGLARALLVLARVEAAAGGHERVAIALGAIDKLVGETAALPGVYARWLDEVQATCLAALGAGRFAAASERGRAIGGEEAADLLSSAGSQSAAAPAVG